MRNPDNFKGQVATLMDNHDGIQIILKHFNYNSDEAAKIMVENFMNLVTFDTGLKDKLSCLKEDQND